MSHYLRVFVSTFLPLWWKGEDYYALPRFDLRGSWFIASVVARTCWEIRQERVQDA